MAEAAPLAPGSLLAGKFRIERPLGAGAMGAVYEIRHELTRHRRALKLLHADTRAVPELVQRFLNEASAAGRAGNAHLVETFDAGMLPSGEPYVVMELLEGETLTALLQREGPLLPGAATELVAQAAEGVDAAHAAGIIHRDLKPDNLFITRIDQRPFVKVLDFGVSKFVTDSGGHLQQTRAGVIYGTPAYMSPEQLLGSLDIDHRADVFGLGVVLYQALTGKLPFDAATLQALGARLLTGAATPIESLRADIVPELASLVRQALATNKNERFASAAALVEALAPFREGPLGGRSLAPSRSILSPAASAPRRGKLLLAGAAAVCFAIGVAVALRPGESLPKAIENSARPGQVLVASAPTVTAPVTLPEPASTQVASAPAAAGEPVASATARSAALAPKRLRDGKPTARATAAATASASPSTAESLGLRNDNPFR